LKLLSDIILYNLLHDTRKYFPTFIHSNFLVLRNISLCSDWLQPVKPFAAYLFCYIDTHMQNVQGVKVNTSGFNSRADAESKTS